jgi:hypothetical protein
MNLRVVMAVSLTAVVRIAGMIDYGWAGKLVR